MLIRVFGPQFYASHQWYQIEACESQHGVSRSEGVPVFGFDVGGWKIVGDTKDKRAFIECVRNRLSVRSGSNATGTFPEIEIMTFAFSHGIGLTYFPAAQETEVSPEGK